ncbi:hypothetical protein YTPLAS18_03930 [Nitrospira sp.]|nr:hypothetical protein YTPLAS18_03930 [Nitrospira sp.]
MKICPECQKESADEARYCSHCGASLSTPLGSAPAEPQTDGASPIGVGPPAEDDSIWRQFIGPKADFYLAKFKNFRSPNGPKYALTWNWAAFIFEPFLWFLYRKMYLYAMVYAIGPVMAFYITQDMSADLVWRIMAGASANYLYYWHIKERLGDIRKQTGFDDSTRARLIHDAGGVQVYVVWVGIGLLVLKFALVVMIFQRGGLDDGPLSSPKPRGVQS